MSSFESSARREQRRERQGEQRHGFTSSSDSSAPARPRLLLASANPSMIPAPIPARGRSTTARHLWSSHVRLRELKEVLHDQGGEFVVIQLCGRRALLYFYWSEFLSWPARSYREILWMVRVFPLEPILSFRRKTLMTRLLSRLRAALYFIACGGTVVALCRSFGVDAKTLGYWCLMAWLVMAGVILVTGLIVPVWEKAGQPSHTRQKRRGSLARTVTTTRESPTTLATMK